MPALQPRAIRKTHWSEHLVRFVFGGAVTMATGLIARRWGPGVGGVFLAFPAILPASLTLLKEHEGRHEAVQAAAGSRLGGVGLSAFAAAVALLAPRGAVISLAVATVCWAVLSFMLWEAIYGRYAPRRHRRARSSPGRGSGRRGAPMRRRRHTASSATRGHPAP